MRRLAGREESAGLRETWRGGWRGAPRCEERPGGAAGGEGKRARPGAAPRHGERAEPRAGGGGRGAGDARGGGEGRWLRGGGVRGLFPSGGEQRSAEGVRGTALRGAGLPAPLPLPAGLRGRAEALGLLRGGRRRAGPRTGSSRCAGRPAALPGREGAGPGAVSMVLHPGTGAAARPGRGC